MTLQESRKQNLVRGTVCTLSKCDFHFAVSRFRETEEIKTLHHAIEKTTAKVAQFRRDHSNDAAPFTETLHFYDMMLKDPELESAIVQIIQKEQVHATEAVKRYFERFMAHMACQDAYLCNRCFDLEDLRNLLFESFSNTENELKVSDEQGNQRILVLDTLLTTDLVRAEYEKFAAVIAREGGMNSHAAILLESAKIPFVILDSFPKNIASGTPVLIDFIHHQITAEPHEIFSFISENGHTPHYDSEHNPALTTEDPLRKWYVSLNFIAEGLRFSPETAEGVGMFRTEMMVFADNRFPSEWELYSSYAQLADHFKQKPVFFRLWDIEPDKIPEGYKGNSFGAKFLINNPELTKKQLRALLQVSLHDPLGITIPMVSDRSEIIAISQLIDFCKAEIRQTNSNGLFQVQIGAMVETTALIEQLDDLPKLDYLIIGSNDLVCDRMKISRHSAGFTPKLFLREEFLADLKQIVKKTATSQIPIYLCGEAANNLDAVEQISQLGIDRFCPSPNTLISFLAK